MSTSALIAQIFRRQTPRLLTLGLAAGIASGAAQAVPPLPQRPLTGAEKLAAFKADAQARSRAAQAAGVLDVTPPQLNRFAVVGDVDAQGALPMLNVDLGISDDLAGVQSFILTLRGPSGQSVQRIGIFASGQKSFDARIGAGAVGFTDGPAFTRFSEPGVWTVDSLWIYDPAYNGASYDAAALSALGRASFMVNNSKGYDVTPPTLVSGRLAAPRISLSKPPEGTWDGTLPFISATLQMRDEGNGAISGNQRAIMTLCMPDKYMRCVDWVELNGTANLPGQASGEVRVWGELRRDQTPGRYMVRSIWLADAAGNGRFMLAKEFSEGTANMRDYFPFPVMTIAP